MAITYKKALKTVVFTLNDGSSVTAADTASNPLGSMALGAFHNEGLITIPGASNITEFYRDKVVKVVVTTTASDEITKADPYCAEEPETPAEP